MLNKVSIKDVRGQTLRDIVCVNEHKDQIMATELKKVMREFKIVKWSGRSFWQKIVSLIILIFKEKETDEIIKYPTDSQWALEPFQMEFPS